MKSISDQIQVITQDLKTLEKAVYQKSDISNSSNSSSLKSNSLNEDILTKHLLKLNEIEDQFRELTNKFEKVNFKYNSEQGLILKNVNLNITGGEMTSLVGHSGAGKSTMLNLIPRFYDFSDGDIKIDNQSIKSLSLIHI